MSARRPWLIALVALVAALRTTLPARGQEAVELSLGTLQVGITSERQAVTRLGRGLLLQAPEGGTIHIYADRDRRASLYVTCSEDGVVQEVQLVAGLARPLTRSMLSAESLRGWRTGAGVGLGLREDRLINYYGEPSRESDIGGIHWLTYTTDYGKDKRIRLYYQASFGFQHEHLVRILIHSG